MNEPVATPYSDCAALIVGGTAGTGLATAMALVTAGVHRVALVGRDPERGARARNAVASGAPEVEVLFLEADAGNPAQLTRAVAQANTTLEGLDIAVSSIAPAVLPALVSSSSRLDLGRQLTEVALPPLLLAHAAAEVMRVRGGSIVLVASDAAKVPTPGESIVGAGMAAIAMYARVAALEGKRDGIRVNVVTPSLLNGTMTTEMLLADDFSRRLLTKAQARADLGPTSVDDVAAMIVFLAGPQAARITGQTISVNGGISFG